jgi:hypothetical protein
LRVKWQPKYGAIVACKISTEFAVTFYAAKDTMTFQKAPEVLENLGHA